MTLESQICPNNETIARYEPDLEINTIPPKGWPNLWLKLMTGPTHQNLIQGGLI